MHFEDDFLADIKAGMKTSIKLLLGLCACLLLGIWVWL